MTTATSQPAPLGEPEGLGGWLIAWAAWVTLTGAVLAFVGIKMVLLAVGLEHDHAVDLPVCNGEILLPYCRDQIIAYGPPAMALLTTAELCVCVLWFHMRRSKHARLLHCLWLLVVAGFVLHFATYPGGTRTPWPLVPLLIILSVSIVGLAYFLRSRRVRNTFVR